MKKEAKKARSRQGLQSNSGFTLIELIVSILVSSVVILSAVLFFSVTLNQYRNTAEETDLMMESQIAVNMLKEVVMEAKEPVESGSFMFAGISYPYIAVRTGCGAEMDGSSGVEEYYHLFLLDKADNVLLYHREAGTGPAFPENGIQNVFLADGRIDKDDKKQYYLADHLQNMSLDCTNPQLVVLDMEFRLSERMYHVSETVLVRNILQLTE